jgi:nucleoside-diphosphate-sugar epimerase
MFFKKKTRVLLTGVTGKIGKDLYHDLKDQYDWTLGVRKTPDTSGRRSKKEGTEPYLHLDITDAESCMAACKDIDVVVHLAADSSIDSKFPSLLENNIVGTYNIFKAAKAQACKRVICASSVEAIEGYPTDVQAHPDMAVRPKNIYGVTKCFAEALASYYAYQEGLSSIAIRIGWYEPLRLVDKLSARDRSLFVSRRDLIHLIQRCIEAPDVPFAIAHGISNNRFKRMDITQTSEMLGYKPEDDSFEITGVQF